MQGFSFCHYSSELNLFPDFIQHTITVGQQLKWCTWIFHYFYKVLVLISYHYGFLKLLSIVFASPNILILIRFSMCNNMFYPAELSSNVLAVCLEIIQGYSKRSIHFREFILQVLLNIGDMLYIDRKQNSQSNFHTLQALDVSPHVRRWQMPNR
jgi:hypothetical protein